MLGQIEGFRLSRAQRQILDMAAEDACTDAVLLVHGLSDFLVVKEALDRLVERHEIFRTSFKCLTGMRVPVQVVEPQEPFCWQEVQDPRFASEIIEDYRALREASLPEAKLEAECVLASDGMVLRLRTSALRADACAMAVLARQLLSAIAEGACAEPSCRYLEFSEWHQDAAEGGEAVQARAHWLLDKEAPLRVTDLGLRRDDDVAGSPGTIVSRLDPVLASRAEDFCQTAAVSSEALFLAVWAQVLARYGRRDKLQIAVRVTPPVVQDLAGLIGPYTRFVPATLRVEPARSIRWLARHVQHALDLAAENETGYEAESDAFAGMVAFEGVDMRLPAAPGAISAKLVDIRGPEWTPFALAASMSHGSDGISLRLGHGGAVALPAARRMLDRVVALLRNVLDRPDDPLDLIGMLCESDRKSLEGLDAVPPGGETLPLAHELFASAARAGPQRIAIEAGEASVTFGDLDARSNLVAAALIAAGVGADTVVAIDALPSVALVVAILGVLKSGGGFLPLEPTNPIERKRRLLARAKPKLLLVDRELDGLGFEPAVHINRLQAPLAFVQPSIEPDRLAYILFTSGSTGEPKGVMITHRGLANYLRWVGKTYASRPLDAPLHTSIAFDLTLTSLFTPLLSGGRLLIQPSAVGAQSSELVKLTPSHMRMIAADDETAAATRPFAFVVGGEALFIEDISPWRGTGVEIFNEYGPTEATVGCCVHQVSSADPSHGPVPIGRPMAGFHLHILDRNLAPVPQGFAGELYIAGAGLARGYLAQPGLTASQFLPDPLRPAGSRMYRTGDQVLLRDDGRIEYLGRIDAQIKLRAWRIEPVEIETVLREHPQVREAAVLLHDDKQSGQRLVGYLVGDDIDLDDLRLHAEARLPAYMVPVSFVVLAAFPVTANGKLDRAALPGSASQLDLAKARELLSGHEEIVAAVFANVLGVSEVGAGENFFARGGDSIRAVKTVALLRDRGVHTTVADLFRNPTVRALAQQVAGSDRAPVSVPPFYGVAPEDRARLPDSLSDAYPLSQLQEGMIYHRELAPGAAVYHDISSFHLRAPLKLPLLRQALAAMVSRHPTLRTRFDFLNFSGPLQLVEAAAQIGLDVEDLSGLSTSAQEAEIDAFMAREKQRSFDLSRLPLVRFYLHIRGEDEWQLSLGFHHAILDGWSEASMLTEMFHHYLSLVRGKEDQPKPPAASVRDFVALERSIVSSSEAWAEIERSLDGVAFLALPRWSLPRDGAREILITEVPIPAAVSDNIGRLARGLAVPVKNVVLAAYMRVLAVLGATDDVTTCVVSSGRPEGPDGERVAGLFINSLPFRLKLPVGSWKDLVLETFETERRWMPYRRFPYAEIVRRRGGTRLSETLFYFTNYHVYQTLQGISDVSILGARLHEETSFALTVNVRLDPFTSQIHVVLKHDGREIGYQQAEQIGACMRQALEQIAFAPDCSHERVGLVPDSPASVPANSLVHDPRTLLERFQSHAHAAPNAVAVIHDRRSVSYAALANRAARLARRLIAAGAGPERTVGIFLDASINLVEAILAVWQAGAAYVPLDTEYPEARIGLLCAETRAVAIVTTRELSGRLQPHGVPCLDIDDDRAVPAEIILHPPRPDHLAYIIHTSGSTGRPKGVEITHANLMHLFDATAARMDFGAEDVWSLFHSYTFDFSVWEMWGALAYGGRLVVVPREIRRSAEFTHRLIGDHRVTILSQTPSAFAQLVAADEAAGNDQRLESVRAIILGGEPIRTAALNAWFALHGDRAPLVINMYGITETTVHVTEQPLSAAVLDGASPIGEALPHLRCYVLGPDLHPVPTGTAGELFVAGAGVARGYLGAPELSAARFLPDPFAADPGARMYRSGDRVRRRPDGRLEYVERIDRQVKIRGFRIELGEIEGVLRTHPHVKGAVAVVRADDAETKIVAYVTAASAVQANELRDFMIARLPRFMVPSAFVLVDTFPLTRNGKVDLASLPVYAVKQRELATLYVEPRNPSEEVLSQIFADVLGLEQVGIDDSFFDLGGHSLLATRVVALARRALGIHVSLQTLYEQGTVRRLAAQLSSADARSAQPLPIVVPDAEHRYQPFLLTSIQQAYWVGRHESFELGGTNSHIYIELEARDIDLERLAGAIRRLVDRHDMLRAVIDENGMQRVLASIPREPLSVEDLSGLAEVEIQSRIEATRARLSHQRFDSSKWPLFELVAQKLGNGLARLHLSIDLLIVDADSLGILNRELGVFYRDNNAALPPLRLSFRDYVLGERKLRDTEEYQRARAYWMSRIDRLPPAPDLPLVGSLAQLRGRTFSRMRHSLDADAWAALKKRAARAGVAPSACLLACYADVLSRWNRSRSFTVNVTTYNCLPLHEDAHLLVGDFTSLTLVSIDPWRGSFEERARTIQRQLIEDMDHGLFDGIQVLREFSRRGGQTLRAHMPVVFTSTLPLHTREGRRTPPFDVKLVTGITQSPQTLLDHQVSEEDGALVVRWDYVEGAFPAGMIEDMFGAYVEMLFAAWRVGGAVGRAGRGRRVAVLAGCVV
ncbi:amino acid adenylation domain-containing protein [Bradyrhizobium japonicum]